MRIVAVAVTLVVLCGLSLPAFAQEEQRAEAVVEKMSFKLIRGVTNAVTSIAEIPKQSILTVRTHGNVGYVVGPLKGLGMALYRALIGATETVFFLVPQPGYYDPMIEPVYVWEGWEERRADPGKTQEPEVVSRSEEKSE